MELLAVVAIIAMLAALSFPALSRMRDVGNRAKCAGNLKQLAAGILAYAGENIMKIPYLNDWRWPNGSYKQTFWMRAISPYLGFEWTDEKMQKWEAQNTLRGLPPVFYCPTDKGPAPTFPTPWDVSYGINWLIAPEAKDAAPVTPSQIRLVNVPKPSQIILLGDGAHANEDAGASFWIGCGVPAMKFSKRHGNGANIAWLDGHVTQETAGKTSEYYSQVWPNRTNWVPGE